MNKPHPLSNICPDCNGFKFKLEMSCKKCWYKKWNLDGEVGFTSSELSQAVVETLNNNPSRPKGAGNES